MYDQLSDCFREHLIVRAWCANSHDCWRSTDIRDDALIRLILKVGDIIIDQLRRRLVCSVCRRKTRDLQVVLANTTTQHLPPRPLPSEALKRVVADAVARGMAAVRDAEHPHR